MCSSVTELADPPRRKVMCYPVQHALPPVRVVGVEHRRDGDTVGLMYKGEVLKINFQHFQKLVKPSIFTR